MAFMVQFIMTRFASNSAAFSNGAIERQRSNYGTRLEINELMACKRFGIKSGSFRILDRDAMLVVMMANVDYTISLTLAL